MYICNILRRRCMCVYIYIFPPCASEELPEFFPRFRLDVTFCGSRFGDDYAESGCLRDHSDWHHSCAIMAVDFEGIETGKICVFLVAVAPVEMQLQLQISFLLVLLDRWRAYSYAFFLTKNVSGAGCWMFVLSCISLQGDQLRHKVTRVHCRWVLCSTVRIIEGNKLACSILHQMSAKVE